MTTRTAEKVFASHHVNEVVTQRARAEFLEMPGLCLTIEQAQRLWGLEP